MATLANLLIALFTGLNKVFAFISQSRMIELGERRKAEEKQQEKAQADAKTAAQIDSAPVPSRGSDILNRL